MNKLLVKYSTPLFYLLIGLMSTLPWYFYSVQNRVLANYQKIKNVHHVTLQDSQLQQIQKHETEIIELLQNQFGIIGLVTALGLCLLVIFIHRRTLRAQQLELEIIHANKMACLGELSAGLVGDLQIPLMKIQGFNSRLKAHFKKDRIDEVSSVWTYTQEIDESVAQMRAKVQEFL